MTSVGDDWWVDVICSSASLLPSTHHRLLFHAPLSFVCRQRNLLPPPHPFFVFSLRRFATCAFSSLMRSSASRLPLTSAVSISSASELALSAFVCNLRMGATDSARHSCRPRSTALTTTLTTTLTTAKHRQSADAHCWRVDAADGHDLHCSAQPAAWRHDAGGEGNKSSKGKGMRAQNRAAIPGLIDLSPCTWCCC